MTRCEYISEELKAFVDGELSLDRRAAIRLHLIRCESCREEITVMESISNELKAGETNGFNAALRERLLESAPDATVEPEPIRLSFWQRRPFEVFVAAAIGVIVVFILWPVFPQARESARSYRGGEQAMKSGGSAAMTAGAPPPAAMPQFAQAPMGAVPLGGEQARGSRDDVYAHRGGAASGRLPEFSSAKKASGDEFRPMKGKTEGWFADSAVERKVIRNASISVRVQKLEEKSESVERLVASSGGFVANNQLSTGEEGLKTASMTVRVPVKGFDQFLRDVAKLGEVTAKNVTGEDITEKLSDDEKEAGVLRSELGEVRKRLATPSKTWQDEESARLLKIRFSQTEGRLELMRKLAALGKVEIQLSEKPKTPIKSGGFLMEMGDTGRAAVNSFLNAARIPVLLLIWILAYAPVWVPLAIGFRYASRAHKKSVAVREAREWQTQREAAKA